MVDCITNRHDKKMDEKKNLSARQDQLIHEKNLPSPYDALSALDCWMIMANISVVAKIKVKPPYMVEKRDGAGRAR